MSSEQFLKALGQVELPFGAAVLNEVAQITDEGDGLTVRCDFPVGSFQASLTQKWAAICGESVLPLTIKQNIKPHQVQQKLAPKTGIANLIAVSSAKGGVGKSSVTVNLAATLAQMGARVGVLDADIYGPSLPRMLGVRHLKPVIKDKRFQPVMALGMPMMSIGFLLAEETPTVWRGPMATGALMQLLNDTDWPELDYLLIDMPPGTGDIQLTLSQKVPVSGAVVVTTPQDIATLDARKGLNMFEKVGVSALGVIENMSHFQCPSCDARFSLFGESGGKHLAEQAQKPLLGQIPINIAIRKGGDEGLPMVIDAQDTLEAMAFKEVAWQMVAALAKAPRALTQAVSQIKIESDA